MGSAATKTPPRKRLGQGRGRRAIDGFLLGVPEAAVLIGMSQKMLRSKCARRLIPFKKLGHRLVFLRNELEVWVEGLDGCTPEEARENLEQRQGARR
jgi:hypothetical protein